jgi:hypothetical protein
MLPAVLGNATTVKGWEIGRSLIEGQMACLSIINVLRGRWWVPLCIRGLDDVKVKDLVRINVGVDVSADL